MEMDQQKFLEAATYVMNLKMFPFFDAANYIIMCLMVRDDNHSSSGEGHRLLTDYNSSYSGGYR